MKTKFMGVAAALIAALALVFGVAVSGALPSLPAPTAQAQTTQAQTAVIPVSPTKQDFKNTTTVNSYTFTVDADATMNSLDFTVTGKYFLISYVLKVNGSSVESETLDASQKLPYSKSITGLNRVLKKGDTIDLQLQFNYPKVQGSVTITPKGTLGGDSTQPEPDPEPENPASEPGTVTPADPTLADPATAPECVEKAYINIPDTKGVDYYLNAEKKPAGRHVYEQNKPGTVKVTAVAQPGFKLAPNARSEWTFNLSGEVKDCSDSSEDPKPPAVEGRHFDAIGHEFAVKADPVDPKKPNAFTAKVTEESHMKYATVRIETDATFLDPQKYNLTLDQIESGVTLQKRNVNIGNGFITMDVVPVKDGKPVDSAVVPKDAVFTFTNNLSQNKNLKVTLDVYGEKKVSQNHQTLSRHRMELIGCMGESLTRRCHSVVVCALLWWPTFQLL